MCKSLFHKSKIEALHAIKNNVVVLKTYNNSNIEQIGAYSVKLRHKDKVVRCRFFVVLGDGSVLLEMPDIELLGILKITCDVVEDQQLGRKLNSQTMDPTDTLNCRANMEDENRSDSVDIINNDPTCHII